ncbi:hypothetical protein Hanom_Chr11g01019401 [Helianthus anomalus]
MEREREIEGDWERGELTPPLTAAAVEVSAVVPDGLTHGDSENEDRGEGSLIFFL